ncbi:MAG: hypothetical protein WC415_02720 [Patescibacteria group bacterium]|jgi:hypothetical protein
MSGEKDILGKVVRSIAKLPLNRLRVLCDLSEKMQGDCGDEWWREEKKFLVKKLTWAAVSEDEILRFISGGESLTIDGSDGTLVDDGTITWYFDEGCKEEGADEPCPSTDEVAVEVHEMVKDATFTKMIGSVLPDLQKVFSSRDQIRIFALNHPKWLRGDGFATFFPYKSKKGNFFVADVNVRGDGLYAFVFRLGLDGVWHGESRHRLVAPSQL